VAPCRSDVLVPKVQDPVPALFSLQALSALLQPEGGGSLFGGRGCAEMEGGVEMEGAIRRYVGLKAMRLNADVGSRSDAAVTQQRGHRFARFIAVGEHWMKAVATLVVPGRTLLIGMTGQQRCVQVDCHPARRAGQLPHLLARPRMRPVKRGQQARRGCDLVNHPERCRVRRDRPKQQALITNRAKIALLECRHRARARVEDQIRNDKQTGLSNLRFATWSTTVSG